MTRLSNPPPKPRRDEAASSKASLPPPPDSAPTSPSLAVPTPPPALQNELQPARGPEQASAGTETGRPGARDSLGPGASVWPTRMGSDRQVSASLVWIVGVVCLGVGYLLGFLVFGAGEPTSSASRAGEAAVPLAVRAKSATVVAEPTRVDAGAGEAHAPEPSVSSPPPSRVQGRRPAPKAERSRPAVASREEATSASRSFGADDEAQETLREQLSPGQIQRTVRRYQPSLRHACWQRQLSLHAGQAARARISVKLTIAPTGKVTGVTSGHDPAGFPGLASCIKGKVTGWTFPRAQRATTAELPFAFASQE